MASPRDAMITGIGLVSCLGDGVDAHWASLCVRAVASRS